MIYSRITFVGDGVNNQYPLSFPLGFLRKKFITCRVGDETDSTGNPVYREIEFIRTGGNLVKVLGPVPRLGETVVFKRTMPKDTLLHVYHRGSPLTETALDESNQQLMMAIHEVFDTHEDTTEWVQKLIKNVGHITNLNIAVTDAPYGELTSGEFNQETGMLTLKVPLGPKGDKGDPLRVDELDTIDRRYLFDDRNKGFSFFAIDEGKIYFKLTDSTGDWTEGFPFGQGKKGDIGPQGPQGDIGPQGPPGKDGTSIPDTDQVDVKLVVNSNGEIVWVPDSRYDLGDMGFTGFTPDELAEWRPGWYFMNGDYYPNETPQAIQLNKLPTDFKKRWGIINNGSATCVPNFFYEDGRGYFVRAADGNIHKIGEANIDTIRPITGSFSATVDAGVALEHAITSGSFARGDKYTVRPGAFISGISYGINIDSSQLGEHYSGVETAPMHRNGTPIIYLGV